MFETKVYLNRRKNLKERIKSGLILLLGNEECGMNYAENYYHFRQDSTFLYYFGLNEPHVAVIIDLDEDKEILFGNDPAIEQIIWKGPVPSLQDLATQAGIEEFRPYEDLKTYLQKVAKGRKIHFLPPYRPEHEIKLQNWLGFTQNEQSGKVSMELIKAIANQRSRKSKREIEFIEEAVTMTSKMQVEAIKTARAGMKEYEVMSRVHQKALEQGGQLSFPIILTKNGQILHNQYYGNTLEEGDMLLCDAGAEHRFGYAGDLTRTFPVSKRFSNLQRTVYQIVLDAQKEAEEKLAPGVKFREVHLAAAKKLTEGLKSLGLMKGDAEEAVKAGAHTMFFQCGLGHLMGLDVHDMENLGEEYIGYDEEVKKSKKFGLKSLRLGKRVEAGFIVTIEPGIYIIPELIDLWGKQKKHEEFINYNKLIEFKDFGGIRIEDCYEITEKGCRILGEPVPKKINEIEELRAQALENS